jgi:hypothetical protein
MNTNQFALQYHFANRPEAARPPERVVPTFLRLVTAHGGGSFYAAITCVPLIASEPGQIDIHYQFQPDVYFDFQSSHGDVHLSRISSTSC